VTKALRTVVATELRLTLADQQFLAPYARVVRYGTDEIVQYAGMVPTAMTFIVAGSVRLTVTDADGTVLPFATLNEGSFIGVTALTRQPNLAGAYALEEVTAVEIEREHLEKIVMDKPMLLQDLGRLIDERQNKARLTRGDRAKAATAVAPGGLKPDTLG
jgi:CRP-like cAMP-binding protein